MTLSWGKVYPTSFALHSKPLSYWLRQLRPSKHAWLSNWPTNTWLLLAQRLEALSHDSLKKKSHYNISVCSIYLTLSAPINICSRKRVALNQIHNILCFETNLCWRLQVALNSFLTKFTFWYPERIATLTINTPYER